MAIMPLAYALVGLDAECALCLFTSAHEIATSKNN
jgi:hypothetical protein